MAEPTTITIPTLRVLSIDLGGERVGRSFFKSEPGREPQLLDVGVWLIQHRSRTESPGVRWLRLRQYLDEVFTVSGLRPDLVAYEEVRSHTSHRPGGPPTFNVFAAHAYGAGQGILLAWCAQNGLEVKSQPIATIKAAATGKGGGPGTDKAAVLAAARLRWPFNEFVDDNASDSAFIGLAALIELGRAQATKAPEKPRSHSKPKKKLYPTGPGLFDKEER